MYDTRFYNKNHMCKGILLLHFEKNKNANIALDIDKSAMFALIYRMEVQLWLI